jgi:hypothetical protein
MGVSFLRISYGSKTARIRLAIAALSSMVGVASSPAVLRPAGLFSTRTALAARARPPSGVPGAAAPGVYSARHISWRLGNVTTKSCNFVFLFLNLALHGFMIVSTLKKGGDPEANEYR